MKYYLYSTEPSFEFEEEVGSFEFSDIESKSIVDDFIHDEITNSVYDSINSSTLSKKHQGFFPAPDEISTDLYSQIRTCLEQRFGGKIFGKVID